MGPGSLDMASDGQRLLFALDRTRPRNDGEVPVSNRHGADLDHGVVGLRFTTDQFIGMRDGNRLFHTGEAQEPIGLDRALVVQHADRYPVSSRNGAGRAPFRFNQGGYGIDLSLGCLLIHDYQHDLFSLQKKGIAGNSHSPL